MKTIAMATILPQASNNRDRLVVILLLVGDSCFPPCQPGYVCCGGGFCAFSRCTGRYCVVPSQCSSGESCCHSRCVNHRDCSGLPCTHESDCGGETCCGDTCQIGVCNCVQDAECPIGQHCCHGACSSDDCLITQTSQHGKNAQASTLFLSLGFVIFVCVVVIFAYVTQRGRRKIPLTKRLVFTPHDTTGKDAVAKSSPRGIPASSDAEGSQGTSDGFYAP